MAKINDGLGILALVQSFDEKAVNDAQKAILSQIKDFTGNINESLDGISIDKDLFKNLIKQIESLPKELRQKMSGISFDFFEQLINSKGSNEKINAAFQNFTQKMLAFNDLKSKINNDEILIKVDTTQLEDLISKQQQILELQEKINKATTPQAKSGAKRKLTRVSGEFNDQLNNLGVVSVTTSDSNVKVKSPIKEEDIKLINKYSVSAEEAQKKLKELYKAIESGKDSPAINKDFIGYFQQLQDLGAKIEKDYKDYFSFLLEDAPFKNFSNNLRKLKEEVKNSELTKNVTADVGATSASGDKGVSVIDETKLKEQNAEMEKIKKYLAETETQLNQINQKYEDQNKLVAELENKLKEATSANNKNIVDTDEIKKLSSQLDDAKKKVNDLETELKQAKETLKLLQDSVGNASGEVISETSINNAEAVINNLNNRIKELEASMSSGEQQIKELSDALAKLQQEKTDLSSQLEQQKQLNAEQEKQVSNYQQIKAELESLQSKYKEVTNSIKEMEKAQSQYLSLLDNFGSIEAFNKSTRNVDYNEGKNTPEGFINFDYLEKAKQKLEETGSAYEKAVKAAVYYNQYLQKGGTEKIFDADGKDVSDYLKSVYKEMSVLASSKTGLISEESIVNIVRQYASELIVAKKEQEADRKIIAQKNKELEKSLQLEKSINNAKKQSSSNAKEDVVQDTTKAKTTSSTKNLSKAEFVKKFKQDQEAVKKKVSADVQTVDMGNITSEQKSLESLKEEVDKVKQAINEKTNAIKEEASQMDTSVDEEIAKLEQLKDKVNEVKGQLENALSLNNADNINKNSDKSLKTDTDLDTSKLNINKFDIDINKLKSDIEQALASINIEKEVELVPKLDADRFKSGADALLSFVDVDKEVKTKQSSEDVSGKTVDKDTNTTYKKSTGSKTSKKSEQTDEDIAKAKESEASYKRSTEALKDLNKARETLAKWTEENSTKLKTEAAYYEDLINKSKERLEVEKQLRETQGLTTEKGDTSLSNLEETLNNKYAENREKYQFTLPSVVDNAQEEASIEYSNRLLAEQKKQYDEIWQTKIKIRDLEGKSLNSNKEEKESIDSQLSVLREKKSLLDEQYNSLVKEINQFDKYIDKQKQQKQVETLGQIDEVYQIKFDAVDSEYTGKEVVGLNKLYREQISLIQKINVLLKKQENSSLNDDEQRILNSLSEEYLKLQANVTEELNKQHSAAKEVADALYRVQSSNINIDQIGSLDFTGDDSYKLVEDDINEISSAINKTRSEFAQLQSIGHSTLFDDLFDEAVTDLNELNNKLADGKISIQTYDKEVDKLYKNLKSNKDVVQELSPGDDITQSIRRYIEQMYQIDAAQIRWTKNGQSATIMIQDQDGAMRELTVSANKAGTYLSAAFGKPVTQMSTFDKFLDQLNAKMMNLGTYLLSFVGFYEIWAAIQQGVTYVRDLDTALTEMKKVSDETTSSLKEFQNVSFEIADSVGSTAKEIQNSTADWINLLSLYMVTYK